MIVWRMQNIMNTLCKNTLVTSNCNIKKADKSLTKSVNRFLFLLNKENYLERSNIKFLRSYRLSKVRKELEQLRLEIIASVQCY